MTELVHTGYLVLRADGEMRVTKRTPRLKGDEVAFRVRVKVPNGWGQIRGDIEVQMPEPPRQVELRESLISIADQLAEK